MSIALQALMAEQGALGATSNNIANVNTPGYTRKIPIFTENPTIEQGHLVFGAGVTLQQFQSVRNQLLQLRIYEETQQEGNSQAQLYSLQQVEGNFSDSTQGIGAAMTAFFSSLSQLSTDPTSTAVRQQVLSAANRLANAFHQSVASLEGIQSNLNQAVPQTVSQINQLTQQIAKLNAQVAQMEGVGQDPGTVQDQRDELIRQLSGLIDISVTQTEHGVTLTTANGIPLVAAGESYALQSGTGANAMQRVFAQGQDITSEIQGGSLGGTLQVRDQLISGYLADLDTLASQFTDAFNTAHKQGYDLSGTQGGDFFTPLTAGPGAASSFGVAISDTNLIAASSDGSNGSNGNLALLSAIQNASLPSGQSPMDMYSNLVLRVGNDSATAHAEASASGSSLQQLTDQRAATSGVSIDEETTNMLQYQRAYEAAARVITTVDQMMQTLLAMKT
jgi:flagellar hook-associated protein 1 FlgK